MAMAKRDLVLKAQENQRKRPNRKPKHHGADMVYVPQEGVWRCTREGCTRFAVPKDDALSGGRPVVARGELEAFSARDRDGSVRVCLRAPGNNVIMDITDILAETSLNQVDPGNSTLVFSGRVPFVHLDEMEQREYRGREGKQQNPFDVLMSSHLSRPPLRHAEIAERRRNLRRHQNAGMVYVVNPDAPRAPRFRDLI